MSMMVRPIPSSIHVLLIFTKKALRIEWCRSRARAMRWKEEVMLLSEEMRRVLAFFLWEVGWWRGKAYGRASTMTPEELEGAAAYAERQASIRLRMHAHFSYLWRFVPLYIASDSIEIEEESKESQVELEDDD